MNQLEKWSEEFAHKACDELLIRQGAVWGGTFEFCKRAFLAGFEKCREEALKLALEGRFHEGVTEDAVWAIDIEHLGKEDV